MPLVPRVGRRSAKVRLVLIAMYALLSLGGVTMVVPFLITITASFANRYDYARYSLLPSFLWRDDELRMKVLFERYAEPPFDLWASHYGLRSWQKFEDARDDPHPMQTESLDPLDGRPPTPAQQRRIDDYLAFLGQLNPAEIVLGAGRAHKDGYQRFLQRLYCQRVLDRDPQAASWPAERLDRSALDLLNTTHALRVYPNWARIKATPNTRPREMRRWFPETTGEFPDWVLYVQSTPVTWRIPITGAYIWHRFLVGKYGQVAALNRAWNTEYASVYRVPFDWRGPGPDVPKPVWIEFLRTAYPPRWVEVPDRYENGWREFAQRQFQTPARLAEATGLSLPSFDELPSVQRAPDNAMLRHTWVDFLDSRVPPGQWLLRCPERDYADFLRARYDGRIEKLNEAYASSSASFADVAMPIPLAEAAAYQRDRNAWRWRFLTDNYRVVLQFITTKGRALWNTAVLVALSLFAALTVNPLAAYALSRFQLKSTHRILLFLLATMAFPAEVAMIPSFLLLRDLSLLNTFAALVLPGVANGFGIFLLKGFFDSVPNELYEAADLDGAGELRKFATITMPLAKPILAVIALQAFLGAYGGFLWALLVCQDQSMWTLMVFLFQFQQEYINVMPWVVMASIVVASIPTLLVYLFCQRIILRGIILPTMK